MATLVLPSPRLNAGLVSVAARDAVGDTMEGRMATSKQNLRFAKRTAKPPRGQKRTRRAKVTASRTASALRGGRSPSKQDMVLGMLRQPKGTTIADVVRTTGWQPHSVRGFFAGVVRKKLRLKLDSEKVGKKRIYRIAKTGSSS